MARSRLNEGLRRFVGPLALILFCPPLVMLVWYTNVHLDGSVSALYAQCVAQGVFPTVYAAWAPVFFGTKLAWAMLGCFIGLELLLMRILPGKRVSGCASPKGVVPVYKANGLLAFVCTMGLFFLASLGLKWFSPGLLYDELGGLLGALNLFSLLFCLFLYFKGRYRPSTVDSGASGNFIFDYFWGTDVHPRLLGWDVKMFVSCRFGMIAWALLLISYAAKQNELYGLTNSMVIAVALQLIYIIKFFIWEPGYLRSMDMTQDRAGFGICWGCFVWVPAIYTSPTLFLVGHPRSLEPLLGALIMIAGAVCICINYFADRQRYRVRLQNGACTIWNSKPEIIFANYKTEWGEEKQGVLLASGWWGISRHFHYIPEILAAFFWSLPALFDYYIPYFYLTYLMILLLDRVYRQERRCKHKYGQGWEEYCKKVPFRLIPFVY